MVKAIALLVVVGAWLVLFYAPPGWFASLLHRIFASLGIAMILLGAFSYWWDGSLRPEQQNASLLICGILTLGAWVCSRFRSPSGK